MKDFRTIDWKRTTAEATAIVVSILIAFSIDAWWQERSEKIELVEYLIHFENEVIANDDLIDTHLELVSGDLIVLHKVLLALSDPDLEALPESFNHDLGNALWFRASQVSMDAHNELTNSGNLRFVNNARLKENINEYRNRAKFLDASFHYTTTSYLDHILPTLGPHIALSSLGWSEYDEHLAPDGENTGITPDAPFLTNVAGLKSQAAWNVLFNWKTAKTDESRTLKAMKSSGLKLRDQLRAEIEFQNQ